MMSTSSPRSASSNPGSATPSAATDPGASASPAAPISSAEPNAGLNAGPPNPLLDQQDLPRFADFNPAQVAPGLDVLLDEARSALARATSDATPVTWNELVLPLQRATERLSRGWATVRHLKGVADSPALREAYNGNLARVTEFFTQLGQSEALFGRFRALRASGAWQELDQQRQQVIQNDLRDFRLGGAELVSPARERFAQIQETLAQLQQKFSENVLDATGAYGLLIQDESRLKGLPEDVLEAARAEALRKGEQGWRFTLHMPSYLPVMQYAADRGLRETLYRAYTTRASEGAVDNAPLIRELLRLRQEQAALLGQPSYSDLSLVPKMAESPEAVRSFLLDLADRARPFAQKDLEAVQAHGRQHLDLDPLQAWDMAYVSEHLKQARYAFSDQEVKEYFQLPRVLDGLFGLIQKLFAVRIERDSAQTWHPDVQFFRIVSADAAAGGATQLVGQFYLDLYAREGKQPGAWMDDCRGRRMEPGLRDAPALQTPVAHLVCNFQAPVGGRPSLLTHDDVSTLFHEFGHGLHHMLTRVDALGVSGIAGVEWDAVELPSQFMENWAWRWEVVQAMSSHVDDGRQLPRALFDRMLAGRNFQAGLQTLRQIEFSLFDLELHCVGTDLLQPGTVRSVLQSVRDRVAVVQPPAFNRFENSFSHIFAGGYSAGYYSYKWAEVLSADCFAAFEEQGLDNPATGRRFLDEILARGGSRPAIDSFRAFRGRDPAIDALLRHNGMIDEPSPVAG